MPYASEAQRRKFHSDPKLKQYTAEWDEASKGKKLPERTRPKPSLHSKIKSGMKKAFPK